MGKGNGTKKEEGYKYCQEGKGVLHGIWAEFGFQDNKKMYISVRSALIFGHSVKKRKSGRKKLSIG